MYLPARQDELLRRLAQHNQRQDANALTVTDSALKDFFARFQPPAPDEDSIVYTGGDTEHVYVASRKADYHQGTPFGGIKHSGLGREGGAMGIEEFLETST